MNYNSWSACLNWESILGKRFPRSRLQDRGMPSSKATWDPCSVGRNKKYHLTVSFVLSFAKVGFQSPEVHYGGISARKNRVGHGRRVGHRPRLDARSGSRGGK